MVIVDRLTKFAHFIPVATTYKVRQYVELYISHIVRYHGVPMIIVSDRGSIFVAHFWNNYMSVWALTSSKAQHITHRQSESIKSSKICSMLVF
jgi:hypothetical protein